MCSNCSIDCCISCGLFSWCGLVWKCCWVFLVIGEAVGCIHCGGDDSLIVDDSKF